MAYRPLFLPNLDGPALVKTVNVTFDWFSGPALSQKQRSIDSLHAAAKKIAGIDKVMEASNKSKDPQGSALSAFNLMLAMPDRAPISVECAFQGSKVFEQGGPFTDIYDKTSLEAKRDERLQNSGQLTGFRFMDEDWPLEPSTAFHDWLYVRALNQTPDLIDDLAQYAAFTDIEFNPEKNINSQAYSIALYVSLSKRNMLDAAALDKDSFLKLLGSQPVSNSAA
jgi:hypothetical protein